MRVIVLLLAVLMMTGVVGQVASAAPDVVTAVDQVPDVPDVDAPALVESAVMLVPERQTLPVEAWSAPAHGRMHAVLVYRPPR